MSTKPIYSANKMSTKPIYLANKKNIMESADSNIGQAILFKKKCNWHENEIDIGILNSKKIVS